MIPEDTARQVYETSGREMVNSLEVVKAAERVAYLARKLEVSERTIRRWCKAGRIESTKFPGGLWRISSAEVSRLVAAQK